MTRIFRPGGPKRYKHQQRGLKKMLETGGVTALLFEPGTGKTATTLDYASILALKSPTLEARVLVAAPLAAIDT
jgi:ABC-type Na+ transport system ATPase subunit NatA